MQSKRKVIGVGTVVILLFVFGVSQLQAQSPLTLEGVSNRLKSLTRTVATLQKTSATKTDVRLLTNRISTLEANGGMTRLAPIATRNRPTSTPTRSRPTVSPTPSNPFVTITRNMNVRRGPSTEYAIVGVASIGEEFEITGKNATGNWWRIEYEGQNAWIYAPYVTATNADRIRAVPTPAQPPTPTPPPVPTQEEEEEEWDEFDYAFALVVIDRRREDLKRKWDSLSTADQYVIVDSTRDYLILTSEYCNMPIPETAGMINRHGRYLDDVGFTTRNDIRARAFLMLLLTEAKESPHTPSGCDNWLGQAVRRLLASE